jgi:hypothetical protein
MRRILLVGAVVLVAAGCTEARQRAAAQAVERQAKGAAQCTRGARMLGGSPVDTTVFVCNVKRDGGVCDRYRVTLTNGAFAVKLEARRADCLLPTS